MLFCAYVYARLLIVLNKLPGVMTMNAVIIFVTLACTEIIRVMLKI